jgi:hypothetical protein
MINLLFKKYAPLAVTVLMFKLSPQEEHITTNTSLTLLKKYASPDAFLSISTDKTYATLISQDETR